MARSSSTPTSSRPHDERAVVLHDRRLPGTRDTIDQLIVAPSGIWVVEAIALAGRVAQRNVGGWFAHQNRLYVSDQDQSPLLATVERKAEAVERTLDELDRHDVSVDRVVCFTSAEWPRLFPKPLRVGNVWVTWPSKLAEMIVADGPLDVGAVRAVARHLDDVFTPVSRRTPG